ncbi:nmra-like family [Fusarium albosuccineum]|uniref:Nmra-like family n=1 Tax=Fusarium albosuccineum TaxID=1237068 RepID=A0A8H4LCM3_9HYPO|nr:nmra-like family [Fusarium albosuccineum]
MAVIAVVGGSGSIGRAIVEAIVAAGKLEVIILSRKADPDLEKSIGARIVPADYTSVDSLVKLFEEQNIGTVLSALSVMTPPEFEDNLIQAAVKSKVTKRFIPSGFGGKYGPEQRFFPIAAPKIAAEEALEKTDLEWTIVCNGFFLDYWGMPKIKSYLSPSVLVLDIPARKAAIPGSGDVPVVFTYSGDVAKYTAALLTLDKWDKVSYVIGDKITWNNFVATAEEVLGTKFDVVHDSIELLKSGKITELPSQVPAYAVFPKEAFQGMCATFGLFFEQGLLNFDEGKAINRLFPEIKPKSIKDVVEIGWKD